MIVGNQTIYASVDDVPDQLVLTPLQRAIQIMKRHRDVMFSSEQEADYAPISMIVTTLVAHLYRNEPDVHAALTAVVSKLRGHAELVENRATEHSLAYLRLIECKPDGKWYIRNPVNPEENFADRWYEDKNVRARAFFRWVDQIRNDVVDILTENRLATVRNRLAAALGASVATGHLGLITLAGCRDPDAPLFPSYADGNAYYLLRECWRAVCADAKLGSWRLHDLRHTVASQAVMSVENLPLVGVMLGHRKHDTTARYTHVADGHLVEAAENVGRIIADTMESKSSPLRTR